MKNITPFQWFVIAGLLILVVFSWISYNRQQKAYQALKANRNSVPLNTPATERVATPTAPEDKPIMTVREFMGLLKDQLSKRDVTINA